MQMEFEGFGGIRLAADGFGEPKDPPVVLLPPLGQVRQFWFEAAKALADAGRFAICLDYRGHGDSERSKEGRYDLDAYAADIRAILASLPSRAVVVAAGFGALSTLVAVGESSPHLVSAMVLVDANIWFEGEVAQRLFGAFAGKTSDFVKPEAVLEALAQVYPDEPQLAAHSGILAAFDSDKGGSLKWRGDPQALSVVQTDELQERLVEATGKVGVPVMLLRGSLNETVTSDTIARLQELISGSESAEIEGAGHYAAVGRQEVFNSLLLDFVERKAPRKPLTYMSGSEPRILRDALGCFGTGVTIVTTMNGEGEPIGLTANSFTSVSLDPPLILFSLAKTSGNLVAFEEAGRFAVNVLHIGQQPDAWRFATRGGPRFESIDWMTRDGGGSPILRESLASFDCRTYAVHDGGDHLIFIGEVEYAWYEPHRDPLLYFRGKFRSLHFA